MTTEHMPEYTHVVQSYDKNDVPVFGKLINCEIYSDEHLLLSNLYDFIEFKNLKEILFENYKGAIAVKVIAKDEDFFWLTLEVWSGYNE